MFLPGKFLVRVEIGFFFLASVGPADNDFVYFRAITKAKVQSRAVLRKKTGAGVQFGDLSPASGSQ